MTTSLVCIGSVLWDIIGRTSVEMRVGHDVAGRITRLAGGVAYNIAQELVHLGMRPILLTSVGKDDAGRELMAHCASMGMETAHVHVSDHYSTDAYMAIEGHNGLIAAIADAHSLEQVGDAILAPLAQSDLGDAANPYSGTVIVDGNLTSDLLTDLAHSPLLARADVRVVPASPGKATRLLAFLGGPQATLYVNRIEAEIICGLSLATAQEAAAALVAKGAARVIVTDGSQPACDMTADGIAVTCDVPRVTVARVTGAGDTLVAAHVHAEMNATPRAEALKAAVAAASRYVSGAERNA